MKKRPGQSDQLEVCCESTFEFSPKSSSPLASANEHLACCSDVICGLIELSAFAKTTKHTYEQSNTASVFHMRLIFIIFGFFSLHVVVRVNSPQQGWANIIKNYNPVSLQVMSAVLWPPVELRCEVEPQTARISDSTLVIRPRVSRWQMVMISARDVQPIWPKWEIVD
jgi:hypothetical protein